MVHPLVAIFLIVLPFTIVSGLLYFVIVLGGRVSLKTSLARSIVFALRCGLQTAILWAYAYDIGIYLPKDSPIVYSAFYAFEAVLFATAYGRQRERTLHFILSTASFVVLIANSLTSIAACDRSAAPMVFAHEAFRYILTLVII